MKEICSIVKSDLKRRFLIFGLMFAIPAILTLMAFGIYATPLYLERWGLLIFTLCIGTISYGLIPYRRLCRLELFPRKIVLTPSSLVYRGHTYPYTTIESISYTSRGRRFGMVIKAHEKRVFLPYFSESQCEQCHAYVQGQQGAHSQEREDA